MTSVERILVGIVVIFARWILSGVLHGVRCYESADMSHPVSLTCEKDVSALAPFTAHSLGMLSRMPVALSVLQSGWLLAQQGGSKLRRNVQLT